MEIVNLKDLINKPGIVRKVVKIEKINAINVDYNYKEFCEKNKKEKENGSEN